MNRLMLPIRNFNHFTLIGTRRYDRLSDAYACDEGARRQPQRNGWRRIFSAFTKMPSVSRESVLTLLVFAECPFASHLASSSSESDGKM
jgi:hypothetical protein